MLILLVLYLVKLFLSDWKNKFEQNTLLIFGSIIFILIGGEIFSRFYYHLFSPKNFDEAAKHLTLPRKADSDHLSFIDIVKVNSNIRLPYELRPNVTGIFEGKPLITNSIGIRDDREIIGLKNDSSFRIIGLGDSVMFGQGVEFENSYGEVLEDNLNQSLDGVNVEFINLAVPGYNTTMEVESFFQKGVAFNPDLVIIGFVGNDLGMPYFIGKKESALFSKKSFLSFYLTKKLNIVFSTLIDSHLFLTNKKSDLGLVNLQHAMWRNKSSEFIPDEYKFMIGREAYIREIKSLKTKCDELNIPLIISYDDEMVLNEGFMKNSFVRDLAEKLDIPFVDTFKESEEFLVKEGLKLVDLWLPQASKRDRHPNDSGHFIRGEKMASFIFSKENYHQILKRK